MLPKGYTFAFLRTKYFVSSKAEKLATDLILKAQRLGSSGQLALFSKTLATLRSHIVKKDWDTALIVVEALVLLNCIEGDWPLCDSGKRVTLTNKVYGACIVTVLHALKKEGRLDTTHIPSLPVVLRRVAWWGDVMKGISCPSDYDLVCMAIGARLFKSLDSDAEAVKFQALMEAWLVTRTQEERDEFQRRKLRDERNAEDEEEEDGPWFAPGIELDEDELMKSKEFVLPSVWKEYRDHVKPAAR